MLIFLLLMVEEDIFRPDLPGPEIEPNPDWVLSMDKNYVNIALNPQRYGLFEAKYGDFKVDILSERDFENRYFYSISSNSISYSFNFERNKWRSIDLSEFKGWKWFYSGNNLLLGWADAKYFRNQDTLFYGGGIRYYHIFPSVSLGGWVNYKHTPDYGMIFQYRGFRFEFGRKRICAAFIGNEGDFRFGRFREEFPLIPYPLENVVPEMIEYYGMDIDIFNFELKAGRKDVHNESVIGTVWEQGENYFITVSIEEDNYGLEYTHQNMDAVTDYGEAFLKGCLGPAGYELRLRGYSTPVKFLSTAISLWLDFSFSPYFSIRNLTYSGDSDVEKPLYYLGFHYAY